MLLEEVARDGQPQPEAAVPARRSAVGLAEPIEHVRQELRVDAGAGVLDLDRDAVASAAQRTRPARPPA